MIITDQKQSSSVNRLNGSGGNQLKERLKQNISGKTWDELCEIWFHVEQEMKGSGERHHQLSKRGGQK